VSPEGTLAGPELGWTAGFPDLRFFATSDLLLHEEHDPDRVDRLVRRLQEDGVLRNPPLVAELGDGRSVVLDGANRVTALQAMGALHVPVQIVRYADPSVGLDRWHHLLLQAPEGWLHRLQEAVPLQAVAREEAARLLSSRQALACVRVGGTVQALLRPETLGEGARWLRALVASYRGRVPYHRVESEDMEALQDQYGPTAALVAFVRFDKGEILELARNAAKLPAGVTRHVVPSRALRVNLPLDVAFRPGSTEEKNAWLRVWVRERVQEGRVRAYPEPTVLFDE
jgi:hypothetical protein